jgi:hypothetical protein
LFGIWIGATEEIEVSGWVIGVGYGGLAAIGTTVGLLLRRGLHTKDSRSSAG